MHSIMNSAANFVETVVVGAGVVGLATARALAIAGYEVLILDREPVIGSGENCHSLL